MRKLILGLALSMLAATPAQSETSVWVAKSGSSVLYLGGTVHVLRESDFPYPPEFDRAYEASELVVFETDFNRLNSVEAQQALMAKMAYTDGTTLEDVLSAEAYAALEEYSEQNDFPLRMMRYLRPSMVMMAVLFMELEKIGINQAGVDAHYHGRAGEDGKTIEWFETVEEQIDIFAAMGEGNESAFVLYNLEEVDELHEKFHELTSAWKTGDEKALNALFVEDIQKEFPKLYETMVVDRNKKWTPKIAEYLATPETEFVLVGAGHLVGELGVINQLRALGYDVEKLE